MNEAIAMFAMTGGLFVALIVGIISDIKELMSIPA